MISDNREWKILDFDSAASLAKRSETATTPFYCAPELLKAALTGKKQIAADTAADMWSFGVIAYEVLTGGCRTNLSAWKIFLFLQAIDSMDQMLRCRQWPSAYTAIVSCLA